MTHRLSCYPLSPGFANCSDVLPVYIGDDRTDEDAFKVRRAVLSAISTPLLVVFVLEQPGDDILKSLRAAIHHWHRC
jgi:trehalose-6-phosphatase